MPKVKDIIAVLENYAPPTSAESWDNPGLQVGDYNADVAKLTVALDPTPDIISDSIEMGAELLVTHHPLLFPSISTIDTGTPTGDSIAHAIINGLSIYCAHTNLDRSSKGPTAALVQTLALKNVTSIDAQKNMNNKTESLTEAENMSVLMGELSPPLSLLDFAQHVKRSLGATIVRLVGNENMIVRFVAVCGGSGGDYLNLAHEKGAHVFVTGEVGYHRALQASFWKDAMGVIEAGHYYSERGVLDELVRLIDEASSHFGWEISTVALPGKDPFIYI